VLLGLFSLFHHQAPLLLLVFFFFLLFIFLELAVALVHLLGQVPPLGWSCIVKLFTYMFRAFTVMDSI